MNRHALPIQFFACFVFGLTLIHSCPIAGAAEREPDVWVLAGQSNAHGWALFKAPVESDPRILRLDSNNRWVQAEAPLQQAPLTTYTTGVMRNNIILQREGIPPFSDGLTPEKFVGQLEGRQKPLIGIGPGMFFARHLLRFIDRRIGIIPLGAMGSSIKQWDPKSNEATAWYKILLSQIRTTRQPVKGILWYQGETDAWLPRNDHYEADLINLIDSFRRDLNNPELPFIYVQIGRFPQRATAETIGGWEAVREAQRRVMSQRKNIHLVSAIDLPLDDTIHLSFEGQMRLGRRLAEVALSEVYHLPGHGHSINLISIEPIIPESENPMLRLRFRGISGRLHALGRPAGFELRPPLSGDTNILHAVYRVDFEPASPESLIVGIWKPLNPGERLIYGGGMDPYVNIVDDQDMPIPALGPIDIPLVATSASKIN